MSADFKRNLITSTGFSMLILIISSAASLLSINSLLDSTARVNHTNEVIYNINSGMSAIMQGQTSMRGYLITGKEVSLSRFAESEDKADSFFEKVAELSIDNPVQQKNAAELKPFRKDFFAYLKLKIEDKRQGKVATSADLDEGMALMDIMRKIVTRMENEEKKLLAERVVSSEKYATFSIVLIVIAALIALVISVVFFIRILRDYTERAKLHQQLAKSEKETAERIAIISNVAGQISKGNYEIRVQEGEGDALGSVAVSLNNMAGALGNSFALLSNKEWMQSGIAELNTVMIGEKSLEQLTMDVMEYVANYTGSSVGALYTLEGNELSLSAGYSHEPDKIRKRILKGQGLTGQAFVSGKILELKTLTSEDIKISYALGEAKPRHVLAIPLIDDKPNGVMELATVKEYTRRDMEFLTVASNNIAIAISAAQNRKRLQELLEETEAQSEELRVQHSELENMNAELETQTEKLQASEEELRVQQEELQQTNEELAERSVLLEEKNMEIQKKSEDLEISTRYKSEFLANMSHELRTPLNSILLLSRLLSDNNEANMSTEQVEFAKVIQSSGNGLLGLIDEILDLSKIEAGKMDLEFIDLSVKEITDSLRNLFTEVSKEKKIEFSIISKNAPLVIKTDKMRLEQILKNLISNALKFTPAGGSVSLEVKKHETDSRIVSFVVKDTGIGIPANKQPIIFEAFQQADGSTKRKYGGTGLGLSISRELAKLLKGQITLKSKENEGSEFTLSIPVSGTFINQFIDKDPIGKVIPEAPAEEKNPVQKHSNKFLSLNIPDDVPDDRDKIGETDKVILIVEDDINFAKSLLDFTRKRGYKGVVSVRGDFALNLAILFKPVGVLLDIQLPIKSGWEVIEELKNNAQTRHIPVHIMSSHKLKQESMLKGAINFLDKPSAFEQMPEVFARIEHIINRESQKVLIFEDNPKHAKALSYFLESHHINSEIKSEITDGIDTLQNSEVDCVILDMGIPDKQAYEVLESIKKSPGLENLPVIVFTGKSLSLNEELKIKKYADSIVIKTAHSYQRMLDEVSLFLHLVEDAKKGDIKKGSTKQMNLLNNVLHEKTVLLVDDDVRNIFSLTKALEVLKMNVLTAIDGKEALKVLAEHPEVDVVLLDMMMPNMDGYETATRIRQNNKFKNLPVIAVTAKAMTGDRDKCINAGASDYITKPVDIDQLLSLLRVWLYDKN